MSLEIHMKLNKIKYYFIFSLFFISCAQSSFDKEEKVIGKNNIVSGEVIKYSLENKENNKIIKTIKLKDNSNNVIEKYSPLLINDKLILKRFLNKKIPFYKSYKLSFESDEKIIVNFPINIEKSIIISGICNQENCNSLSGNVLGGVKTYINVDSFKFSPIKLHYDITSPYTSLSYTNEFSSAVSNDYIEHVFLEVPKDISSYIALIRITAYNDNNEYVENAIPIKVVNPIEVKHYGKYELAETYEPVPVTGCIPGSVGNTVNYSESQSETKQNSVSITINKNWSDSFTSNTSFSISEGVSVSETQNTVLSSSLSQSETQSESFTNSESSGESNNISFNTTDGESWSWSLGESNSESSSQSQSNNSNTSVNGSTTVGVSGEGSLPFLAKASGKVEVSAGVSQGWGNSNSSSESESKSSSRGYSTSGSNQSGKTFGSVQNDVRSHSLSGSYILSNNTSNTLSESNSLSSGRVWNMSESISSGKVVSVGNSESISQTIVNSNTSSTTFSYSGYIPRGRFGMFHRQTSRYIKLSEIVSYDLNGFPIHAGYIVMNNWSWAPDLKIGNSCEEVLNSNLPDASCIIQPCGE